MKQISVADKTHIKQLLYSNLVLGVKHDRYRSFGGFQLWWYERDRDTCLCCYSSWSDGRKRVEHYSLDKAAKTLWHARKHLYVRSRQLVEDNGLHAYEHL